MGVKISLATAVKRHGWVSRGTYISLVKRGFLQNYPTPGGHIRIDEDELLRLINGKANVVQRPAQESIGDLAKRSRIAIT